MLMLLMFLKRRLPRRDLTERLMSSFPFLSKKCDVWTVYLLKVVRVVDILRIVQTFRNTQSPLSKLFLSIKYHTTENKA